MFLTQSADVPHPPLPPEEVTDAEKREQREKKKQKRVHDKLTEGKQGQLDAAREAGLYPTRVKAPKGPSPHLIYTGKYGILILNI